MSDMGIYQYLAVCRGLEHSGAAADGALLKQLGVAIHADDFKAETVLVASDPFTETNIAHSEGAA
jgi:hypothetical protein